MFRKIKLSPFPFKHRRIKIRPATPCFDIIAIYEKIKVLAIGINTKKHILAICDANFTIFFAKAFDRSRLFSIFIPVFGLSRLCDPRMNFKLFVPDAFWLKLGDVEFEIGEMCMLCFSSFICFTKTVLTQVFG